MMGRAKQLYDIYWKAEIDRIKAEAATMVPRKHYTDAVKSLTVCQQQIETLVVELRKYDQASHIAQDASTVLGLLESMIDANPDMQTDDYRDSLKQRRDEAERVSHEKFVAKMGKLSGTAMDDPTMYITGAAWNGPREYVERKRKERKP